MKIHTVYLVGCGGTGSILAEPLVRLLAFHPEGTKDVTFIDGDEFEEKNRERQLFSAHSVGKNKARAMADRLDFQKIRVVSQYVDQVSFAAEIATAKARYEITHGPTPDWMPLVILALDNAASRNEIYQAIDAQGWQSFFVLDPGNDLFHGLVSIYAKVDGQALTPHPFDVYPNIKEPQDELPMGCSMKIPSTPQLITANMMAATGCLNLIMSILADEGWFQVVHFNAKFHEMGGSGAPVRISPVAAV